MSIETTANVQQCTVEQVGARPVRDEGAEGIAIREVFTDATGAPTFAMRRFDVDPGGHTPFHTHAWEHEVYILDGQGELRTEEGVRRFQRGDALFVAPGVRHQFAASPAAPMQFLCMIPVQKTC
ncbi:MAG TPA: cupin domain-containing protein [Candidatus Limnocylindrales bacterium]|nr:cupin domain-containing protein [Candidatus Limnocylindrales bacterium]